MGTILGSPIIRTIVFWGLYWGPPTLGNDQIGPQEELAKNDGFVGRRCAAPVQFIRKLIKMIFPGLVVSSTL